MTFITNNNLSRNNKSLTYSINLKKKHHYYISHGDSFRVGTSYTYNGGNAMDDK